MEIKPILYVTDDSETVSEIVQDLSCMKAPIHWGFQHADWHESCFQKCVVHEKICAVILSITCEIAARVCSESLDASQSKDCQTSQADGGMGRLSRFCIYLLNKIIVENNFSWEDVTVSSSHKHCNWQVQLTDIDILFLVSFLILVFIIILTLCCHFYSEFEAILPNKP